MTMRMAVIGDSILWGQGLRAEHKIGERTHQILVNRGWDISYDPEVDFLAHSGAIIGNPGQEGLEVQGGLPHAQSGEVPTEFPTLYQQLGRLENPREIDLLLLDGGANDFGFMNLAGRAQDPSELGQLIESALERSRAFIAQVRQACPNALLLYSGYYAGVSWHSHVRTLHRMSSSPIMLGMTGQPLLFIVGAIISRMIRSRIEGTIANNMLWHHLQLMFLRRAVAFANRNARIRGPGIAFVHPRFGIGNSMYSTVDTPFVRGLAVGDSSVGNQKDAVFDSRAEACGLHYGAEETVRNAVDEWIEDVQAEGLPAPDQASDLGRDYAFDYAGCRLAASFHPLETGAAQYAKAFADTFERERNRRLSQLDFEQSSEAHSVKYRLRSLGLASHRQINESGEPQMREHFSLREALGHTRIDVLQLELSASGIWVDDRRVTLDMLRSVFSDNQLGNFSDRLESVAENPLERVATILEQLQTLYFTIGNVRKYRLVAGGHRHDPESGSFLDPGPPVRFNIDPSYDLGDYRFERDPLRISRLRQFSIEYVGLAGPLRVLLGPVVALVINTVRLIANGSEILYESRVQPRAVGALRRGDRLITGERGLRAYGS